MKKHISTESQTHFNNWRYNVSVWICFADRIQKSISQNNLTRKSNLKLDRKKGRPHNADLLAFK
jgi:hypothetical protein